MTDTIIMVGLIVAFLSFGTISIMWPQKVRRMNFGFFGLIVPLKLQLLITRLVGVMFVAFSLALTYGLIKSLRK